MWRQQDRWPGRRIEVEIVLQIAQDRRGLPHVRAGVGTPVGRRVESGAAHEVVLDELQVGVEGKDLVIDVACRAYGLMTSPGTRSPYPLASTVGGTTWS